MSFFPLPHKCTIQGESFTTDKTGQQRAKKVDLYTDVNCLFLEVAGSKESGPRENYGAIFAFYVEPSVDIRRGHFVVNIKDKDGNVIEAGPLEVHSAKRTPNLSGGVHHISCKLKGQGKVAD